MTPEEGTRATLVDDEPANVDDPGEPDPGDCIGRYVLLHRVGAGGMGVVFAARDPELDRTVALKILRTRQRDRGEPARARFVREAQAMARLAHPNVVEIYDVGTHADFVFIAMELVDGLTLSRWLREAKPAWREIVCTFIAAGRGLAAAHAHGIVHRDFKPDNVLLSIAAAQVVGVRVVDFGLARGTESVGPWSQDGASSSSASRGEATASNDELVRPLGQTQLTGDGCVMGTPGYMAPEQHRGRAVDPRTDQYAFCIALYEALYGTRPFEGRSLAELLRAKELGVLPPVAEGGDPPPSIRDAIARGVSPAPDNRFPGMDALLAVLETAMRPRRVWPYAAATAIVGTAIVVVAQPWAERAAGCDDPQQRVAAVWNDERRTAAASAFESFAFAHDAWTHTEIAIDGYASAWVDAYRAACDGDDEAARDRTMACLADRLDGLDTVVSVLAEADGEAVQRAVSVTTALPPPQTCTAPPPDDALPLPDDPKLASAVLDVRRRLNRASLLDDMGRYQAAATVAEGAFDAARVLDWPPIHAETTVALGGVLERTGEYRRSGVLLEEGTLAAQSLGLDRVALDGITELVYVIGFRNEDLARAERWARQGLAMLERLGEEGGTTEARLLNAYGSLWDALGDFETSRVYFERARTLFEEAHGPVHPNVATARQNVGIELMQLGDYEAARVELARALEIHRETGGAAHPDTANALDNLGSALQRLGRNDEALAATREALQIRRAALGADHPEVARSYTNLGAIDLAIEDFASAEENYAKAVAIFAATMGDDNATTAAGQVNHAMALERNGKPERALEVLHAAGRSLQAALPAEHPHHAWVELALARTHLALGQPTVALQHADEALARCKRSDVEPMACALARFARAQSLWPDVARRDESVREADVARIELEASGAGSLADRRDVETWLRDHASP